MFAPLQVKQIETFDVIKHSSLKPRDLRDYNSAQRYYESSTKKEDYLPVSQRCP